LTQVDAPALLAAAQAGDLEAFEELQLQLEPPIRRFVRRLIGSNYAEDDIVQDVFIALYYNMHRINPVANVRPYLYRMARNRCYDELRRHGRIQELSLDEEPVQLWVSFTNASESQNLPDEAAHWLLLHMEVREAIDQLPEAQRQAMILYAEEELSYAEIAEAMGTSIGTIKSRIFHAKKNLRGRLRPETLAALDAEFAPTPPPSFQSGRGAIINSPSPQAERRREGPGMGEIADFRKR